MPTGNCVSSFSVTVHCWIFCLLCPILQWSLPKVGSLSDLLSWDLVTYYMQFSFWYYRSVFHITVHCPICSSLTNITFTAQVLQFADQYCSPVHWCCSSLTSVTVHWPVLQFTDQCYSSLTNIAVQSIDVAVHWPMTQYTDQYCSSLSRVRYSWSVQYARATAPKCCSSVTIASVRVTLTIKWWRCGTSNNSR